MRKATTKKKKTPVKGVKQPETKNPEAKGGAPKGNEFWKLRSKHGRDKIFSTPDILFQEACEYFTWCDENPWMKKEAIKSGERAGDLISIPTQRPYTLSGLCLFLNVNTKYFNDFKDGMKGKEEEPENQGFSEVITRIEEIIRTNKFEGAVVGAYNANIIARDLGLVDKKDMTTGGESMNKGYYDYLKARKTKKEEGK